MVDFEVPDLKWIEVRDSPIQGKGVFAKRRFAKGEVIGEYTGERIPENEADKRHEGKEQFYIFITDDGTCIDPHDTDTPIKFINHSCNPNCESFEEDGRIFIRAIRTIRAGREITYDYQVRADEDEDLTCTCGAPNCRGSMRGDEDDD